MLVVGSEQWRYTILIMGLNLILTGVRWRWRQRPVRGNTVAASPASLYRHSRGTINQ